MKNFLKKLIITALFMVSAHQPILKAQEETEFIFQTDIESIKINKGITSFFTSKPGAFLTLGLVATGACWLKRYYDFYHISAWLKNSSPLIKKHEDFKFSGWEQDSFFQASSLKDNYRIIRQNLVSAIRNPSDIYIFNEDNSKIEILSFDLVRETIFKEIEEIQKKLLFISKFTELPQMIVTTADLEFGDIKSSNNSVHNKVLLHCKLRHQNDQLKLFEELIETNYEHIQSTFEIHSIANIFDRFVYRPPNFNTIIKNSSQEKGKEKDNKEHKPLSSLYSSRSLNPLTWSIGSRSKATTLYYELLNRYLRLLVLKDFAHPVTENYNS